MDTIEFKKNEGVSNTPSSFANLAFNAANANILVSNHPRLIIETSEEICSAYSKIAFRILVWGNKNSAKTHLALTFPPPVCLIDTEDRAKLIIPKFRMCKDCNAQWVSSDKHPKHPNKICDIKECPQCGSTNVSVKDIRKIKVINSQQAREAARVFIDILNKHYEQTGKVGTIVVDNISKIWDWVQNEYAAKRGKTTEDRLSPRDDYKNINPEHNENFRDVLLNCKHNVILIATSKSEYGDANNIYKITGCKAEGQKHNPFAVDWEIYNSEGEILLKDGKTIGNGEFMSYILKNSLVSGVINPIKFLDYNKLVTLREKLLAECGVSELPKELPKVNETNEIEKK